MPGAHLLGRIHRDAGHLLPRRGPSLLRGGFILGLSGRCYSGGHPVQRFWFLKASSHKLKEKQSENSVNDFLRKLLVQSNDFQLPDAHSASSQNCPRPSQGRDSSDGPEPCCRMEAPVLGFFCGWERSFSSSTFCSPPVFSGTMTGYYRPRLDTLVVTNFLEGLHSAVVY